MPDLMQPCRHQPCPYREVPSQGVCVQHGGVPKEQPRTGLAPLDHVTRICSARRRDGGPCRQPAIKGAPTCRMHGGSAPQVRERAAERVVEEGVVELAHQYGVPRAVTPEQALTEELARTQGHVDWLAAQLDQHREPQWLLVYQAERNHLAKISQQMAALGLRNADREEELRCRVIDQLEMALRGILTDLGHNPDDDVTRGIVVLHLRRMLGHPDPAPAARWPRPVRRWHHHRHRRTSEPPTDAGGPSCGYDAAGSRPPDPRGPSRSHPPAATWRRQERSPGPKPPGGRAPNDHPRPSPGPGAVRPGAQGVPAV